jgi:hypothetical protein
MFKLANLFVEIQADKKPFDTAIAGLQGKLGAVGTSLTSSLSNTLTSGLTSALSAIPGPVGIAVSAFQGLLSILGEGNKDVAKLGEMFDSALAPVKAILGDAVHGATELFSKFSESTGILEIAGSAVQALVSAAKTGFTAITAPIGTAFEKISQLFAMVKIGGDDFADLGHYFTGAIAPVLETFTDISTAVTDWVASLTEGVQSSAMFKSAIEQIGIYAEAAFDNVRTAIDMGVAQFMVLKAAGENLFETAQIWFEGFQADCATTFGGSLAVIQGWGAAIQTWVIDKAELVGIAVRNWVDVFELVGMQVQEKMINLGEVMYTIPANAAIIAEYIAGNWRALIVDGVSAVGAVFKNLGENIGRVAYAIAEFLRNPTGGIKFEWTPLLDGFKATAAKLPELLKPNLTDMSNQFETVANRIAAREAAREGHAKEEKDKAAAAAAIADPGGGGKFKSQSFGVAEFASRMRLAIQSDGGDDVPKQALDAAKKTAKATEDIAEAVKKPKGAVLG